MIVYGHRTSALAPRTFLEQLVDRLDGTRPADRDRITELLVDVGEAESAVLDALMPDCDREDEAAGPWRELAGVMAAAACATASDDVRGAAASLDLARLCAVRALAYDWPAVVRARTAEGFAYHALYPEQYIDAAEQLAPSLKTSGAFCLGVRGIGSMLAHLSAAALQPRGIWTTVRSVRPHGHPFDRQLRVDTSLARLIHARRHDTFAIIDEGPGLSGSSFAAAAELLEAMGIERGRIVLIASWNADPERLVSTRGKRAWQTYRHCVGRSPVDAAGRDDFSGGQWRQAVLGNDRGTWPPVQPQHERVKLRHRATRTISRFAGLGIYGIRTCTRAARLHEAGFGPSPEGLANGMLSLEWLEGTPARSADQALLRQAARYAAFLRREFSTGDADDLGELRQMAAVNAAEAGLDLSFAGLWGASANSGEQRVAIDGRMLAHEWIVAPEGVMKVDALDHHADDFFPACRDIAWDLAGASVEWNLDGPAAEHLLDLYVSASGDRQIRDRMPFYSAAYASYRLGYVRLAATSVEEPHDRAGFAQLEHRYADYLRRFQRRAR